MIGVPADGSETFLMFDPPPEPMGGAKWAVQLHRVLSSEGMCGAFPPPLGLHSRRANVTGRQQMPEEYQWNTACFRGIRCLGVAESPLPRWNTLPRVPFV